MCWHLRLRDVLTILQDHYLHVVAVSSLLSYMQKDFSHCLFEKAKSTAWLVHKFAWTLFLLLIFKIFQISPWVGRVRLLAYTKLSTVWAWCQLWLLHVAVMRGTAVQVTGAGEARWAGQPRNLRHQSEPPRARDVRAGVSYAWRSRQVDEDPAGGHQKLPGGRSGRTLLLVFLFFMLCSEWIILLQNLRPEITLVLWDSSFLIFSSVALKKKIYIYKKEKKKGNSFQTKWLKIEFRLVILDPGLSPE